MPVEVIKPAVLLLSHKFDFSTDNISVLLKEQGVSYFRLNRDELPEFEITMVPDTGTFNGKGADVSFEISPTSLRSVYYRAPTFPREVFNQHISPSEQLNRSQWAAFVRSLIIYDTAFWVNNPVATYRAEMKPYQLSVAKRIGFEIPRTIISNSNNIDTFSCIQTDRLAIKTIDTGLVSMEDDDAFAYTSFTTKKEIENHDNSRIPFIAQEALIPKIDLRVTVVGERVFPVSITSNSPIDGDWRLKKNDIVYTPYPLPAIVSNLCVDLLKRLELNYGAIDLIYSNGEYYFIELNPTGEWDWLLYNADIRIDTAIANLLNV